MSAAVLGLIVAGGVAMLLFLVMGLKLHAFVALLVVSIIVALLTDIPLANIADVVEDGMGGTLGFVAVVVGLGAMFGEVLRSTGGAERIAETLVDRFGERRVPWALALTGLIVAIPVFFDVALVLLIPLVYSLAQRYGRSVVYYGIPLLAGISAGHSLIPPTPGPIAAAGVIGADLGWVILFGLAASIPAVIVGGVFYGKWIGSRIEVGVPEEMAAEHGQRSAGGDGDTDEDSEQDTRPRPSFLLVLTIILVPLVLILLNTGSEALLPEGDTVREVLGFVGDPFVALIVAVLLAFYVLGLRYGKSRSDLQKVATKALEPVGMILLVTGAGGVFGEVLQESGVGDALEDVLQATNVPVILLAFGAALLLRVALGSATVATVTAAAIVAPTIEGAEMSAPMLGAIVVAISAGATMLSHVNDSGFWLVNRFLGLTEKQTLQSWTVMQTILGLVSFGVVLAATPFL